jgi:16S rRNA (guanine966-N2)-methyltransferase
MRIIAGQAKGHRLIAPPGINTRPTSDRVREALFSVIMPRLDRAKVLDAFAGSGALGLEALSRGAETVHFIEKDAKALKVLRRNVKTCHLSRAEIFFGDTLC